MKLRINYSYIAALSVSIIAALLIGAVVLLISGYDPLAAYSAMLSGAFSNARHIGDVLECRVAEIDSQGRINLVRNDIVYDNEAMPVRRPPRREGGREGGRSRRRD